MSSMSRSVINNELNLIEILPNTQSQTDGQTEGRTDTHTHTNDFYGEKFVSVIPIKG